jgi:hypothetical protein
MLGDENRVAAHRSLLAVVLRMSGTEPLPYDAAGVTCDFLFPLLLEIGPLLWTKPEPHAERRGRKSAKYIVECPHRDHFRAQSAKSAVFARRRLSEKHWAVGVAPRFGPLHAQECPQSKVTKP